MDDSLTRHRRCQWKPVCLATLNPFHVRFFCCCCWSFKFSTGQRSQHNAPQRSDREIKRDRARENQLAHTGARDLPPVRAASDTKRERDTTSPAPPPHQKRSESFAARLRPWAQAQGMGEGQVRGPTGAGPAATGGQRRAGPSRGQTCSCGCRCGGRAGSYRGRFYVKRSSGSWDWDEKATGSECCHFCWGLMSPLQESIERVMELGQRQGKLYRAIYALFYFLSSLTAFLLMKKGY